MQCRRNQDLGGLGVVRRKFVNLMPVTFPRTPELSPRFPTIPIQKLSKMKAFPKVKETLSFGRVSYFYFH